MRKWIYDKKSNLRLFFHFRSILSKMRVSPHKTQLSDHDDATVSPQNRQDNLDPQQGTSSMVPLVAKKHCCKMLKGEILSEE